MIQNDAYLQVRTIGQAAVARSPAAAVARSLADARPAPYWLEQPVAPERAPALQGDASADIAVIGGGFTGLWTALLAR